MKLTTLLLLLFVAFSGNAKEITSTMKIINPVDYTLNAGNDATFVIEVNSSIVDTLEFVHNDYNISYVTVDNKKDTYCEAVKLFVGSNNFVINAYNGDKLVKSESRNLYFFADVLEGSSEEDSEEYEKRYFHEDVNEDKCKKCHDMTSNIPTDGEAFEDVKKTTCYNCHKAKVANKNTHAPVANWLCLDCHDGKVAEYNMDQRGLAKYIVRDPVAKTCAECHDTVEDWFMNKYTHGPTNDGRCIRCHNPHGSDNEFFLRKPVWDLCVTCHSEKANGKHIIPAIGFGSSTTGGGHPTKDRKDPVRKGRDFYCSSCHNPHGSSGVFLLRMKGNLPFNVCRRCHNK